MTSERKIKANRANARGSTGPKTARGRARAAQNAFRHGLSLPLSSLPYLSEEVEALADEIAGPGPNAEIQELARRVAEAQIDLRRIRYARHKLLSGELGNPQDDSRWENVAVISALPRPNAPEIPMRARVKDVTSSPEAPDKFATILSQEAKRLLAWDRYERRALFRRKIAIQALDTARCVGCKQEDG